MKCDKCKDLITIKEYDPKPKNPDGSTRWYLYRWDDGKDGYRKLVRCNVCGSFYLIQCYRLSKFAKEPDAVYEDMYAVRNEVHADRLNGEYTGIQLELSFKPAQRIKYIKGE